MKVASTPHKIMLNNFMLLWLTSGVMHSTEKWNNFHEGILSFIPILILLVYGFSTLSMLIACSVSFFSISVDVLGGANHANLYTFLNVLLCVRLVQQYFQNQSWDLFISRFAPLFRYSLALTYFMAGFHKLNSDFYDPRVSCMTDFLNRFVDIATFKVNIIFSETEIFIFASLAIALELFGGLFLLFKKTQWLGLICAICLHVPLSLIMFYDFASLAFAILYLFFLYEHTEPSFSFKTVTLPVSKSILYYVLINGSVAILAYFIVEGRTAISVYWFQNLRGLIFVISVFGIERKILYRIFIQRKWKGIAMKIHKHPIQLSFLVFLFLFSITSYLGLRTAGNFTMFSNLHTEFEKSNHFLLKHQPLKLFTQQNDIVEIISIDKKYCNIKRKSPHIGQKLPRLQFLKVVHSLQEKYPEDEVYVALNHNGQHKVYTNILAAAEWQVEHPWWLYFISFRTVKPSPRPCNW